jgi:hypothetical protein
MKRLVSVGPQCSKEEAAAKGNRGTGIRLDFHVFAFRGAEMRLGSQKGSSRLAAPLTGGSGRVA